MADMGDEVIAAQRAVDKAWADVEAYRSLTNVKYRAEAEKEKAPAWQPAAAKKWTAEEVKTYEGLYEVAVAASDNRSAVMRQYGVKSSWDTEREMRAAAREDTEA